jgi:pimeloyl-ACP methyl ester carboxylesterase
MAKVPAVDQEGTTPLFADLLGRLKDPCSRLVVYEDTGHLVLWQQPERVASDLADFVTEPSISGQNSTPIS